jgi:hypothetical protein
MPKSQQPRMRGLLVLSAALALLLFAVCTTNAAIVQWVGNTALYLTGVPGGLPTQGAFVEPTQTVTVVTQTYPIAFGQSVYAEVTTDNFAHVTAYPFSFDYNDSSNTHWFLVLPQFPPNTNVQFYIKAVGTDGSVAYDNNNFQNFGFYVRYMPPPLSSPILEWFDTPYNTILQRLPEVVNAGYGALWLPPGEKAGGGGLSVGYNPFDRFDFGDRFQSGSLDTNYGTAQDLFQLIRLAHRLGLSVYEDTVLNHNDNRASTPINQYPDMIPEDFHIFSSSNTNNNGVDFNNTPPFAHQTLDFDLLGMADIAQEDGNDAETGPFNLPSYASFNAYGKPTFIRQPLDAFLYPNRQPVAEDVRQYLKRWGWWLTTFFGFDGFRLDAVRYIPPAFFQPISNYQPGPIVSGQGWLSYLYGLNPNLYVFGEDFPNVNPNYELREYGKVGMNLLDFPLKDNLDSVFNSSGLGNIGATLGNTLGTDGASGLAFSFGGLEPSLGVSFVQSADQGPPAASNQAYTFTLTGPERPVVYYDGNNQKPNDYTDFPRAGRFDAVGTGDNLLLTLLDAHNRYARGNMVIRYSSSNLLIYERQTNGQSLLLAGINIRDDGVALTQTVQTAFPSGAVLTDLTGQEPPVTVQSNGSVTITVPANGTTSYANGTGYVLYVQQAPQALPNIPPIQLLDAETSPEQTIGFQTHLDPTGQYAPGQNLTYSFATVTTDLMDVQVTTDANGNSAVLELDNGLPVAGQQPLSNTPEGLADGYVPMTKLQNGQFVLRGIDLTLLPNGLHVIRVRVFANTGNRPGVFNQFTAFFVLNRPIFGPPPTGNLSNYPPALIYQTQTPSSNSNRLDGLFAMNDDHNLYIGLAGSVDPSENFTNGVALYLDTHSGLGVNDLSTLHDDTGPAGRLLSNAPITLPPGFKATFGVGVLRLNTLFSSPEAPFASQPTRPTPVGAAAGLYYIDVFHANQLVPMPSEIAWQPRPGPFSNPVTGLEIAIPLTVLFPKGMTTTTTIGMVACLRTTGESGTIFLSTDARRGTLGSRPTPVPYLTNQFLPPLPGNNVPDPGTSSVTLQNAVTYTFQFAQTVPSSGYTLSLSAPTFDANRKLYIQNGTLTALTNLNGPVHLLVKLPQGVQLQNATGYSVLELGVPTLLISSSGVSQGTTLSFVLRYRASQPTTPQITVKSGQGAL